MEIESPRLHLRPWQASDMPAFAALNADARVMRYFPHVLSRQESDSLARKIQDFIHTRGWGLWAVAVKEKEPFIGFVGLSIPASAPLQSVLAALPPPPPHTQPAAALPRTPCVEIGWRLAYEHWHKGYATEAARAVLATAFTRLRLPEVVSFTAAINTPSRRVMENIGLRHAGECFDHPALPENSPLRAHVLYRLTREDFLST